MKKLIFIVSLLFFALAILSSSCRTQKQACAAYSKADTPNSEIETLKGKQTPG
jgi:hypothetical protein